MAGVRKARPPRPARADGTVTGCPRHGLQVTDPHCHLRVGWNPGAGPRLCSQTGLGSQALGGYTVGGSGHSVSPATHHKQAARPAPSTNIRSRPLPYRARLPGDPDPEGTSAWPGTSSRPYQLDTVLLNDPSLITSVPCA